MADANHNLIIAMNDLTRALPGTSDPKFSGSAMSFKAAAVEDPVNQLKTIGIDLLVDDMGDDEHQAMLTGSYKDCAVLVVANRQGPDEPWALQFSLTSMDADGYASMSPERRHRLADAALGDKPEDVATFLAHRFSIANTEGRHRLMKATMSVLADEMHRS